jgi:DNA polymerase-3 subunit epsilon
LCRRFDIDNSSRTYHGALLDAELLAEVYLELRGGRQPGLSLAAAEAGAAGKASGDDNDTPAPPAEVRPARPHAASAEELASHEVFIATLKQPMWLGEKVNADAVK